MITREEGNAIVADLHKVTNMGSNEASLLVAMAAHQLQGWMETAPEVVVTASEALLVRLIVQKILAGKMVVEFRNNDSEFRVMRKHFDG